jgi:choline-sulfatase
LEGEAVVVLDEYGPNRMIRTREWKLVHRYPYGPDELYHLTEDAGEEHNLIHKEEYEGIRRLLLAELEEWFAKYVNPAMDGSREGVYGMGQTERAGVYAKGRKNYIPCKEACPPDWPDN